MKYDPNKPGEGRKALEYVNKLIENKSKFSVTKFVGKRTLDQNAYFHAILPIYAVEFGYSLDYSKTRLKRQFGVIGEENGDRYLVSTSKYDTKQMTRLIDGLREECREVNCYIPTPEQYLNPDVQFEIAKLVEMNQEFL